MWIGYYWWCCQTQTIAAVLSGIDSDVEKNKKGTHYIGDIGGFCGKTRL